MQNQWPELSYAEAKDTYETLHLWTQVLGKVKLAKLPWINHSWHVALAVTPKGLSTLDIPDRDRHFQMDLDLVGHQLQVATDTGQARSFGLEGLSVAAFYEKTTKALAELGIKVDIRRMPSEIADAIPFDQDTVHATYNPAHAAALHKALLGTQEVLTLFRAGFRGKCSPVHFFWGGFDMAVTRFSGRKAPPHPGGIPNLPDWVTREAYSHEVSSCGFWPGNEMLPFPVFYSYAYPEPEGFKNAPAGPEGAYYDENLREFILPYETVRQSADSSAALLEFLQSTYDAAADLAQWGREALEVRGEVGSNFSE